MVMRKCRDCGRRGNEDPDDPAPALCASCYRKRLDRLTPQFFVKVERLMARDDWDGNITPLIVWFAEALETIAGETHEYARIHANYMGHRMVLECNQQLN